ncbi:hypothetical protein MalM25_18060 [Planctomycetes bacterium MalM25]|nr:hypothetical protein MalM25_18060 [Planctomycetes bacterium MalM25]
MPLTATKKAAKVAQRRLRQACDEVRQEWTNRQRRQRRVEAFQMQNRLAEAIGVSRPALAKAALPR